MKIDAYRGSFAAVASADTDDPSPRYPPDDIPPAPVENHEAGTEAGLRCKNLLGLCESRISSASPVLPAAYGKMA